MCTRAGINMSEELQMAYDMLHQIQCLPCEHKNITEVDGYETYTTLLQRATMLVKYTDLLERTGRL